jgi:hypothetical protein
MLDVAYNQGWDDELLSDRLWSENSDETEDAESHRRVAWMILKATTTEFAYLLTAIKRGDASAVWTRVVNHFQRPTAGCLVKKLGDFFAINMHDERMGVKEFSDKIYNDARVLKELGSSVTEVQMTVVFLKGLVPELDAVKDLILNEDVNALKYQATVDRVYDHAVNKNLDTAPKATSKIRDSTFFMGKDSTSTIAGTKHPTAAGTRHPAAARMRRPTAAEAPPLLHRISGECHANGMPEGNANSPPSPAYVPTATSSRREARRTPGSATTAARQAT